MAALTYIGGLIVVAIVIIVYYASKTGNTGTCVADSQCADIWIGSDGVQIPPDQVTMVCDKSTNKPQVPNIGPGLCQNPCKPGETACWSKRQNKGFCTPPARPCPCESDKDCNAPHGTCNAAGACECTGIYTGVDCSKKGSCTKGQCGAFGSCNAAASGCFCLMPNFDPRSESPCTACLPGWGPPGSCSGAWGARTILTRSCQTPGDGGCASDPVTGTIFQINPSTGELGSTKYIDYCHPEQCSPGQAKLLCHSTGYVPAGPDMTCGS